MARAYRSGYDARMNSREKLRYHQIHPAKLAVDWLSAIIALFPMWEHKVVLGVIIAFVPPVLASYLIVRLVDLSRYKSSPFGKYMAAHMSAWLQFVRMFGFVLMLFGAYNRDILLIACGLALILLAWLKGVFSDAITQRAKHRAL
jgi:hypothetical protein